MKANYYLFLVCCLSGHDVLSQCYAPTASTIIDVNNAKALITNNGSLWFDNGDAVYEIPDGGGASALFAGGIWIGAYDENNILHTSGAAYCDGRKEGCDFSTGVLTNSTITQNECELFDKIWVVTNYDVSHFISICEENGYPVEVDEIPDAILDWPAKGNPFAKDVNDETLLITTDLAPFVDVDMDGIYNPTLGDYPSIHGDQCAFWVMNDVGKEHSLTHGLPLGLEIHAMAYAFNYPGHLDNTTFYQYKFINKSDHDYTGMYIGKWVDVDLGCFNNDYIGCDTARDLGIVYNGTFPDDCYGGYFSEIPVVAIDFLYNSGLEGNNLMSSFNFYVNGGGSVQGEPQNAFEFYNYLSGRWRDGSNITYGGDGFGGADNFPFMFPDEPSDSGGWSECSMNNAPGERKFIMSSGPINLNSGQYLDFTYAVEAVFSENFSPCPSFEEIQNCANYIQAVYDNVINTKIQEVKNQSLNIYPNPFSDYCMIDLSSISDHENLTIEIFNMQGVLMRSISDIRETKLKIERGNLSSGIYFYRLRNENEFLSQGKLIVN